jgi:hypothetical protein
LLKAYSIFKELASKHRREYTRMGIHRTSTQRLTPSASLGPRIISNFKPSAGVIFGRAEDFTTEDTEGTENVLREIGIPACHELKKMQNEKV